MLSYLIAFCILGLFLFWVVRLGPHNALRAFVVELLSAFRSVLSSLGRIVTSKRGIYCGIAFYTMFAMQWEPLWALAPFIVGALLYRAYKSHSPTGPRDRLPITRAAEPHMDEDIPGLPVLFAAVERTAADKTESSVEDPYVSILDVFSQKPVYWSAYNEPTWRRRGLDWANVAAAIVITPAAPVSEATPEAVVSDGTPVREVAADAESNQEEQQGSFIYN